MTMKAKNVIATLLLSIAAMTAPASFAGTRIQQSELPQAAQTFISTYFPDELIQKVEREKGHRGMEYDVDFASGAEVEFMSDGQWKEVKAAKGGAVPSALVPEAISKYVADNFNGLAIVEISRKRGGYEVELSNGTELKLTEDAQPLPENHSKGKRHR